jgi:hypothetical protein
LGKEVPETLADGNNDIETRKILNFGKTRHVPIIAVARQLMKKEAI